MGILIFKGLTARRLYKSFGVKGSPCGFTFHGSSGRLYTSARHSVRSYQVLQKLSIVLHSFIDHYVSILCLVLFRSFIIFLSFLNL
jgi:hypothetical protein